MSSDLILYWLPFVACIAIVVGSTYYAWKAIYSDRSRGRRRCPKCWYDLAYSKGMTCSECGYTARRESEFTRTKRFYGRAAAGILICVITILGAYINVAERGIVASMPTSILIACMPLVGDGGSEVMTTLGRRLMMDQVTDQQRLAIIRRCVKGDWMVAPPSDAWMNKYGPMLDELRSRLARARGGADLHPMEKPLLDVPARIDLETSDVWPRGTRARIGVRAREWWPQGYDMKLRITSLDDPTDTRSIVQRPRRFGPDTYVLHTAPVVDAMKAVSYDIEVFRRREGDDSAPWESLGVESHTIPIAASDSWDETIQGIESEELTAAMMQVFGGVARWTGGPQPVRFNISYQPTLTEVFDGLAVGVTVELLRDGQVARQLDLWWLGGTDVDDRGYDHEVPFEDVPTLLSIRPEDLEAHWRMRVRSDPELALRAGRAMKHWKGSFEIEIRGVQMNEQDVRPKPRNWWIEEGSEAEKQLPDNEAQ